MEGLAPTSATAYLHPKFSAREFLPEGGRDGGATTVVVRIAAASSCVNVPPGVNVLGAASRLDSSGDPSAETSVYIASFLFTV